MNRHEIKWKLLQFIFKRLYNPCLCLYQTDSFEIPLCIQDISYGCKINIWLNKPQILHLLICKVIMSQMSFFWRNCQQIPPTTLCFAAIVPVFSKKWKNSPCLTVATYLRKSRWVSNMQRWPFFNIKMNYNTLCYMHSYPQCSANFNVHTVQMFRFDLVHIGLMPLLTYINDKWLQVVMGYEFHL